MNKQSTSRHRQAFIPVCLYKAHPTGQCLATQPLLPFSALHHTFTSNKDFSSWRIESNGSQWACVHLLNWELSLQCHCTRLDFQFSYNYLSPVIVDKHLLNINNHVKLMCYSKFFSAKTRRDASVLMFLVYWFFIFLKFNQTSHMFVVYGSMVTN